MESETLYLEVGGRLVFGDFPSKRTPTPPERIGAAAVPSLRGAVHPGDPGEPAPELDRARALSADIQELGR